MRIQTIAVATVAILLANGAQGQTLLPGESVVNRQRPELDPQGMPLGTFRLFPSIGVGFMTDRNIFATDQGEIDDTITRVTPRLRLQSGWSRHELTASVYGVLARYDDNENEDYDDAGIDIDSTLDVSSASALNLSFGYDSLHEERDSPDDADGFEPTPFDRLTALVGFARRSGRFAVRVSADLRDEDYDDVVGAAGIINNDDRDRRRRSYGVELSREFGRQTEVYGRAGFDVRDYDQAVDDNGRERSSDGIGIALGVRAALTGASFLDVFAGRIERDYDDPALPDIDSPWFGGRLVWNPTGLTTVTADVRRTVEETTFGASSGYQATRFGITADHELRRNLLLHGGIYWQNNDYEGLARDDDLSGISVGARYMMNRFFSIQLEYRQRERDSSAADTNDYGTDIVMLTLRAHR